MVKEELVEGMKRALSKGEPLEKAMMSFYNAGYPKEEVEEAARYINSPNLQSVLQSAQSPQVKGQKLEPATSKMQVQTPQIVTPSQTPVQIPQPPMPVIQRASDYSSKKSPSKTITIILFFLLFILIGILSLIIIFKDEIANLLANIAG